MLCWPLICLKVFLSSSQGLTVLLEALSRPHGGLLPLLWCLLALNPDLVLATYRRMPTGYHQPSFPVRMATTAQQSLSPDLQLAPVAPPEAQVKHQQLVQHGPGLIKVRLRSLADA